MTDDKITLEDVERIRRCARELQKLNVKHYGPSDRTSEVSGLLVIRTVYEDTLQVADKIARKLSI